MDDNPNKAVSPARRFTGPQNADQLAQDPPKEFVKHQKVWVNKLVGNESDWVEATVVDFKKPNGAWLYQLKDKNKDVLWRGNPTWFRASQLEADK